MLSDSDKKMFKTHFDSYLELMDRRDALNEEVKLVTQDAAHLLNVKKPIATKVLKELKKKNDKGESEIDEIYSVIEELS